MSTLHFAARQFARSPIFCAVVVLSLAVGMGASTALFSLADAMVLRKLPVAAPDDLVYLEWTSAAQPDASVNGNLHRDPATNVLTATSFAYVTYEALRESSGTLSGVFAFAPTFSTVNADGQPESSSSQLVSGNYFASLGVQALVGRTITDADESQANAVAVISHRYWQRRFASDRGVVGKTITLNGKVLTIVGVLPAGFLGTQDFGQPVDVSYPLSLEAELKQLTPAMQSPRGWWLRIMGRLAPGATAAQAQAELEALFVATTPTSQPPPRLRVLSAARGLADGFREPAEYLLPLGGIAATLLAIVCLNVASLLVARLAGRDREIRMRFALGAGRLRVLRQLLTEALLLSSAGGALGAVLAYWAKDLLATVLPQNAFRSYELAIDGRVVFFAVAASIVVGIVIALLPALHATRLSDAAMLGGAARASAPGRARVGRALLVAQVALSVALLVGAGLLIETVRNLQAVDVGFRSDRLLLFQVSPGAERYDAARTNELYRRLLDGIAALPSTEAVTLATYPLVGSSGAYRSVVVEGIESPSIARVGIQRVQHDFFATIGVPVLSGRDFQDSDGDGAPKVAVISEALARQIPGGALGHHLFFDFGRPDQNQRIEVVGVVRDTRALPSRADVVPVVYLSDRQSFVGGQAMGTATFMVRTATDPLSMVPPIGALARAIDPNIPLVDFRSQAEQIARGFSTERVLALAASAFGGTAMLLASLGLFGLLTHYVQQRTREIGVRMAVGARSADVVALVMRQTFLLVAAGVLGGIAVALALGPAIERSSQPLLFEVAPRDPSVMAAAAALMMVIAGLAAYFPVRHAARVDPTVALRAE